MISNGIVVDGDEVGCLLRAAVREGLLTTSPL